MKKLKAVVLSGAGISAESGIKTFRDADGLWENHDIMDVASPQGWRRNPQMVLEFYNQRRRQLLTVEPNAAHRALVDIEKKYNVVIVTQNIDDLHERAGSSNVVHLHGELRKARSFTHEHLIYPWDGDIQWGDRCEKGAQLRPHIVWFGEDVPLIAKATEEISEADLVIIIGSSMQVYPAAGLVGAAPAGIPVYYVDPNPQISWELKTTKNLHIFNENATTGVVKIVSQLLNSY